MALSHRLRVREMGWLGLASAAFAAPAFASPYTGIDLFTLGPRPGIQNVFSSQTPQGSFVPPGKVVGSGGGSGTGTQYHALLWQGAPTPIDLNPPGYLNSVAYGAGGGRQVGMGQALVNNYDIHALLWSGTADSVVDLNPAGFSTSKALGVGGPGGSQQVGYGTFATDASHTDALLWNGTAASAVDLSPAKLGFSFSTALATDGVHQVGLAYGEAPEAHAILWTGTADSAIDLHPSIPGVNKSVANAIANGQEVGHDVSDANNYQHAMLWRGTAASAVDLSPAFLGDLMVSDAYATDGVHQVGYGEGTGTGRASHAMLWTGTADSAVDLHLLLPSRFESSIALAFDSTGDIFGLAVDTSERTHAVEWAVPEPAAAAPVVMAIGASCISRRRGSPS